MKWKLTLRFVSTILSVVIIVTIINIVFGIIFFVGNTIYNRENEHLGQVEIEGFVRDFHNYILSSNDKIYVSDEGKVELDSNETWIQVLDENGKEIYNYKRPNEAPTKYTPFQIVHVNKYRGALHTASTIFIGEKNVGDKNYSYIIGFPMMNVGKQVLVYNTNELGVFIKDISIIVLVIDSIIALFFGYLFSRRLTKPLGEIISGVEKLEEGDYNVYYSSKGIYSDVYHKLNNLSDTLKSNKRERMKLDKMRDEWIANISHDIKTPLASIKGYGEMLSDDDYEFTSEEIKSYADIIHKKSNYIKELVDDLNLTAKLKNNTSIINKKEINLVKLVRETVIDILNDPNYSERDINFICDEDIILKEVDHNLIKRVINNLLYNALVHNAENVKIEVKIIKAEQIHIVVNDNGKGINPEEIKYIFDRYYRGTNTGKRHKGSGLGMAIAKEIVKAHDGDIKISSVLGEYTETEVIL